MSSIVGVRCANISEPIQIVLLLILFHELPESLVDAKWFAENAFPIWAIQDSFLSLGIYDWSVESGFAGVFDMIGNIYRYGFSVVIQGHILRFSYTILKKSPNRYKSLRRLTIVSPIIVLMLESLIGFFISSLFILSLLIDYIGYIGAILVVIFFVYPLMAVIYALLLGFSYLIVLRIWQEGKII